MSTLNDKLAGLPAERRDWVEQRAATLLEEEVPLRQLRRATRQTQTDLARKLGIGQDGVSRIEQRDDMLVSTLRRYIAAAGGELRLMAQFPDQPPVLLSELGGAPEQRLVQEVREDPAEYEAGGSADGGRS